MLQFSYSITHKGNTESYNCGTNLDNPLNKKWVDIKTAIDSILLKMEWEYEKEYNYDGLVVISFSLYFIDVEVHYEYDDVNFVISSFGKEILKTDNEWILTETLIKYFDYLEISA